jgi:hypothetical protein
MIFYLNRLRYEIKLWLGVLEDQRKWALSEGRFPKKELEQVLGF